MTGPITRRIAVARAGVRRAVTLATVAASAIAFAAPQAANALTIVPHFGTGSAAFSAADLATLNTAISFYQTTFSDPITIDIGFFQATTVGLGQSETLLYGGAAGDFGAYRAGLIADATSADDASAIASIAALGAGNKLILSSADCRAVALGCAAVSGVFAEDQDCQVTGAFTLALDGCVGVNTTLTGFGPTKYSLLAVLEHEIDEVMGNSSTFRGLSNLGAVMPMDLFRYSSAGVRELSAHACTVAEPYGPPAYMSFDSGVTDLADFNNCNNGGDYGDYGPTATPRVQDAFGTPGSSEFLTASSVEVRGLDVIGYTLATHDSVTTPEPATLGLLATGFIGLAGIARRRKNNAV